jgi:chromosomal replication initiator protein
MTLYTKQLEIGIGSELGSFSSNRDLSKEEICDAERVLQYLKIGFGEAAYHRVLKNIQYEGIRNDVMVLTVKNDLIKGIILQSYFREIASFVYSNCKTAKKIELAVRQEKTQVQKVVKYNPKTDSVTEEKYTTRDKSTFENFIYSDPNRLAYLSAKQVSNMILNNDYQGISSLCLFGPVGMGKTHLMKSIIGYVKTTKPNCKISYISAEDFKDQYIDSVRKNSLYRFKQRFAELDALLIDDVQFIHSSTGNLEKEFSRIVNSFVDNRKWIVIACDRPPWQLNIDERSKGRIYGGLKASIEQSDINLRIMILKAKLQELYKSYEMPYHLLEYIATNVIHSIRELESILQSIVNYASLINTSIIKDNIVYEIIGRSDLKLVNKTIEGESSSNNIISSVCSFYNVRERDVLGSSRVKKISRARAAIAYIARQNQSMTLKDIGEILGRKHSTVIYLIKSVEEDQLLLAEINQIKI